MATMVCGGAVAAARRRQGRLREEGYLRCGVRLARARDIGRRPHDISIDVKRVFCASPERLERRVERRRECRHVGHRSNVISGWVLTTTAPIDCKYRFTIRAPAGHASARSPPEASNTCRDAHDRASCLRQDVFQLVEEPTATVKGLPSGVLMISIHCGRALPIQLNHSRAACLSGVSQMVTAAEKTRLSVLVI